MLESGADVQLDLNYSEVDKSKSMVKVNTSVILKNEEHFLNIFVRIILNSFDRL